MYWNIRHYSELCIKIMKNQSGLIYILVVFGIFTLLQPVSAEGDTTQASQTSVSSSSSKGPTYNAEMLLYANNDDCVEDAKVEGNGVSDTLKLPCTKNKEGRGVVNEKNKIVIGGEPGDNHGILGNKPNSLVVLEGGKCVEKSYPPGGKPQEKVLSDADCAAARKDMQETKKKAKVEEEKKKEEFENMGKDLDAKTMDLKMGDLNTVPSLDLNDPFKSIYLGFKM